MSVWGHPEPRRQVAARARARQARTSTSAYIGRCCLRVEALAPPPKSSMPQAVWYRVASLTRWIWRSVIIAAEIRSAQRQVLLDALDRVIDPTAKKLLHDLARAAIPPPK